MYIENNGDSECFSPQNGEIYEMEMQPGLQDNLLNLENSCPRFDDDESASLKKCPKFCVVPACLQKFLPPRGRPAHYLTRILICFVTWVCLYVIIGLDALPGGNIFSIYILLVAASFGGFLANWKTHFFTFPPLLGMLIVGFMLRNIPGIKIAKDIHGDWSSSLRTAALGVILLRSGLGLDIEALKRLKFTVLRLAFGPCLTEAMVVAVVSHLILGMPWLWAFQLGFILGAVSPAVVVPSMLQLQLDGYGVDQGIPTMVMAASSCDDVLAISLFGVFLGIAFSEGDIYFNVFRGPLEIVIGIVGGFVVGIILWYFPSRKSKSASAERSVFLLVCGLVFLFGSNLLKFPGAGALGVLTLGAVASYGWGEQNKVPVEEVMGILWTIFQPLLFGLIGAEVGIEYLNANLIGKGIGILAIALVARLIITYLVVLGNNLSLKEKLFCAVAWLPKATVQAAIGSIPLDTARRLGYQGQKEEDVGIQILTIAVLVILITAPIGAIGISITGPKWLTKRKEEPTTEL